MKRFAGWVAGYKQLEKGFDSEALSFRNQKHSMVRFIIFSVSLVAIGYVLCFARHVSIQ